MAFYGRASYFNNTYLIVSLASHRKSDIQSAKHCKLGYLQFLRFDRKSLASALACFWAVGCYKPSRHFSLRFSVLPRQPRELRGSLATIATADICTGTWCHGVKSYSLVRVVSEGLACCWNLNLPILVNAERCRLCIHTLFFIVHCAMHEKRFFIAEIQSQKQILFSCIAVTMRDILSLHPRAAFIIARHRIALQLVQVYGD